MTELQLWPGLLPLHEARWARKSRLTAKDGVLHLHRGRRHQEFVLRGCRLHPIPPIRDLQVSCPLVAVDAAGTVIGTIDVAEWAPSASIRPGRKVGRALGEPFDSLRAAFAAATEASISSTPWNGETGPTLTPVDAHQLWRHRALLLTLAAIAVVPFFFESRWLVAGGVAAILLIALGLSPVRNWAGRTVQWRSRSQHLGDELADVDGVVLRLKETEGLRAGCITVGPGSHQVDRVDDHPGGLRLLLTGGTVVADLSRTTWGETGIVELRERLAATPGLTVRTRKNVDDLPPPIALMDLEDPPTSSGGALFLAVIAGLGAWAASNVSALAAVLYGIATLSGIAIAVELQLARRATTEKTI